MGTITSRVSGCSFTAPIRFSESMREDPEDDGMGSRCSSPFS